MIDGGVAALIAFLNPAGLAGLIDVEDGDVDGEVWVSGLEEDLLHVESVVQKGYSHRRLVQRVAWVLQLNIALHIVLEVVETLGVRNIHIFHILLVEWGRMSKVGNVVLSSRQHFNELGFFSLVGFLIKYEMSGNIYE